MSLPVQVLHNEQAVLLKKNNKNFREMLEKNTIHIQLYNVQSCKTGQFAPCNGMNLTNQRRKINQSKRNVLSYIIFYIFPYFCESNSRTSSAIFVPRLAQLILIERCKLSGTSMVRRFIPSSMLPLRLSTHASAVKGIDLLVGFVPILIFYSPSSLFCSQSSLFCSLANSLISAATASISAAAGPRLSTS